MRSFFLFVLFFVAITAYNQQSPFTPKVVPPSPEASAFARYGEIPVGNSTGVPKIDVPFFTLKSGNISLSIGFSYHASGIKVRDVASSAGLGWVFNVGGVVSKSIMGNAVDDAPYNSPSMKTAVQFDSAITNAVGYNDHYDIITQFEGIQSGSYDGQSDKFTYNFGEYSGTFVTDYLTGELKTVPYAPLRITKVGSGPSISSFQITTPDGTKYTFAETENSWASTGGAPGGITSWYLTKIQSSNNTDEVNFYYSSAGYSYTNDFIHTMNYGEAIIGIDMMGSPMIVTTPIYSPTLDFDQQRITTGHITRRLDSVVTRGTSVYLAYVGDRTDGPTYRLSKVEIKDNINNQTIKAVNLHQSYFGNSEATARLKLDTLSFRGIDTVHKEYYSFKYIQSTYPITRYNKTAGTYTTFCEDYWGYFNGQPNVSSIPKEFLYFPDPYFDSTWWYNHGMTNKTGNRNPHATLMQVYTLDTIKYPTGGYTSFEYECNKGDSLFYPYPNTNDRNIGGLRIKKIIDVPFAGESRARTFSYSTTGNGYLNNGIRDFMYHSSTYYNYLSKGIVIADDGSPVEFRFDQDLNTYERQCYTSSAEAPLNIINSSPVLYATVTEYNGTADQNAGKTEYYYEYANIPLDDELVDLDFLFDYRDAGIPTSNLVKTKHYRNDNGIHTPVKEINNVYYYYNIRSFNTGIKVKTSTIHVNVADLPFEDNILDEVDYVSKFRYEDTRAQQRVSLLAETEQIDYTTPGGQMKQVVKYDYDTISLQRVSAITINSRGDSLTMVYNYPANFSGQAVYDTMVKRHILSPVVEQKEYNGASLLKTQKTNYLAWTNNIILPQTIETNVLGAGTDVRARFHSYDDKGNIRTFSKEDDVKNSYIWDYNKIYPIAEIMNADTGSVAYSSFESDGKGNWSYSSTPSVDQTAPTGQKIYTLNGSNNITKSGLNSGNTYTVSYWTKNSTAYSITGTISGFPVVGRTLRGWKYFEHRVTGQTTITVGGTGTIDELRLYPVDAQMTTLTYLPLVGISSRCDVNNRTSYYEYDNFNRLSTVRDHDGNVVKKICYNYFGQPEDCRTSFKNVQKSGTYIKNNCGEGLAGTVVTYTVPSGIYSSTISQAYVDSLAQADINANGQSYANAHGSCVTPATISVETNFSGGWDQPNVTVEFLQNGVAILPPLPFDILISPTIDLSPGTYQLRFTISATGHNVTYSLDPGETWNPSSSITVFTTGYITLTSGEYYVLSANL